MCFTVEALPMVYVGAHKLVSRNLHNFQNSELLSFGHRNSGGCPFLQSARPEPTAIRIGTMYLSRPKPLYRGGAPDPPCTY